MSTSDVFRRIHLGTKEPENWVQLMKFAAVGATGYVVNLAVFAALVEGLGVLHILGAVGAFCVAVTNNFLWNRAWTFDRVATRMHRQALRFLAVSVGGFLVALAVLEVLVAAGLPEVAAQALAVAVAMPVNFLGNRLWTFAP